MDTIFVENKPYYINKFDDFLELVRDKISPDAEKYITNHISDLETEDATGYDYTQDDLDDSYDKGKEERETEINKHICECLSKNKTMTLQEYADEFC